jgi:hypothetical protein
MADARIGARRTGALRRLPRRSPRSRPTCPESWARGRPPCCRMDCPPAPEPGGALRPWRGWPGATLGDGRSRGRASRGRRSLACAFAPGEVARHIGLDRGVSGGSTPCWRPSCASRAPRSSTFLMRVGTGNDPRGPCGPCPRPPITVDSSPRSNRTLSHPNAPSALERTLFLMPPPSWPAAKSSGPSSVRPQAELAPVIGWLQVEAPRCGQDLRETAAFWHGRRRPLSPARRPPPDHPGQ